MYVENIDILKCRKMTTGNFSPDKSIFFRLGACKRFDRGFFAGRPQKFRFGAARTSTGKESEIAPGFSHEIFPRSKISKLATNHFTLWSFE